MNAKQLIEELQKLPPDMEVLSYNGDSEEYGKLRGFSIISTKEEEPYAKCDYPIEMFGTKFPYAII